MNSFLARNCGPLDPDRSVDQAFGPPPHVGGYRQVPGSGSVRVLLLALLLFGLATLATLAAGPLDETFKRGLFEEEGNRNYQAAMQAYEEVVRLMDEQRRLAATAVFRLGECYRKLGRTNDAVGQYQRLLRDFPGEETLARLSRENLAILSPSPRTVTGLVGDPQTGGAVLMPGSGTSPTRSFDWFIGGGPDSASSGSGSGPDMVALDLARQVALIESQLETITAEGNQGNRARLLRSFFPASGIQIVEDQLKATRQELEEKSEEFAVDHPQMLALRRRLMLLDRRLLQETEDVISTEQARLATLKAALARLGSATDSPSPSAPAATVSQAATSEEAEEIRRIQALVATSPDLVNASAGEKGLTPLQAAAGKAQMAVARYLLDHGARPDARGSRNRTALHAAAEGGHKSMVELLLDRGAPIDVMDTTGATALHLAARQGFLAVAEVLLNRGANPNLVPEGGTTQGSALYWPVAAANLPMVRLLIEKGADPNLGRRSEQGALRTPLSAAPDLEMVRYLLDHRADPNLDGGQRLMDTLDRGGNAPASIDILQALLTAKARPDAIPPGKNRTPLRVAIDRRDRAAAELLIEHGADIHLASPVDGWAAIHVAASRSDVDWLTWVLDRGANPNQRAEPSGRSAGPFQAEPAVSIPPQSIGLDSPLHPVPPVVGGGAAAGSIPKPPPPPPGATPLELTQPGAVPKDNQDTTRWTRIALLLERGADPNLRFSNGSALIHHVAGWGDRAVIRFLRERKVDLDARIPEGSPLMIAFVQGNQEGVEALIEAGVDVNAVNDEGNAALHFLDVRPSKALAQRLLDAGANPGVTNRFGRTPVDLVRRTGQNAIGRFGMPIHRTDPWAVPRPVLPGRNANPDLQPILELLTNAVPARPRLETH